MADITGSRLPCSVYLYDGTNGRNGVMSRESSSTNSFFLSGLGLLFIGLKLAGIINWSWWLVTLPLWGGLFLIIFIFALIALFMLLKGK